MADIFLSYARGDRDGARRLAETLTECGWSVWWDQTLPVGQNFRDEIARQLEAATCVVVLWSRSSVVSDWVIDEAEDGKRRGVLVQALLEDVAPPHGFRSYQCADLTHWSGESNRREFVLLREAIDPSLSRRYQGSESPV